MELHFIGTAHNDPEAYNRTSRGLEKLMPRIIALEWEGPEYEAFLQDPEIIALRAQTEEAIREVFREFGIDPRLYDQANAKSIWGGEVKATQDFANHHGISIISTESSEERIAKDLESLRNPEIASNMFRGWLASLKAEGKTYNPDDVTRFDQSTYDNFERHLRGNMSSGEIGEFVQSSMWAYRPERVQYQTEQLHEAVNNTPQNGRLVHVGGFLHLLDDGLAQNQGPVNLWQHASLAIQCKMFRHSLSSF